MARRPAVAGQFYPGGKDELRKMIEQCTPQVESRQKVLGVLVPHAGYVFSGATAGKVLASVEVPGAGLDEPFPLDDATRHRFLEGLDDIGITLTKEHEITSHEASRPSWLP